MFARDTPAPVGPGWSSWSGWRVHRSTKLQLQVSFHCSTSPAPTGPSPAASNTHIKMPGDLKPAVTLTLLEGVTRTEKILHKHLLAANNKDMSFRVCGRRNFFFCLFHTTLAWKCNIKVKINIIKKYQLINLALYNKVKKKRQHYKTQMFIKAILSTYKTICKFWSQTFRCFLQDKVLFYKIYIREIISDPL